MSVEPANNELLIRRAEIDGRSPIDVRCRAGRIVEMAAELTASSAEKCIDAAGGALLPGLHDHHIHLLALAATDRSIACGPPDVTSAAALRRALQSAPCSPGWIRGVGYHESVAGTLDRDVLDRWVTDRPVRIQHRSGAAWFVNSPAIERLGLEHRRDLTGVERAAGGRPTGRLYRLDAWLRQAIGEEDPPDLAPLGRKLSAYGVTGVTDASVDNDGAAHALFAAALDRAHIEQQLVLMGRADLPAGDRPDLVRGPLKIVLEERELPTFDGLCATVRDAHADRRTVAIHCVTRTELVFALSALETVGTLEGDRIEHAAVTPPSALSSLLALGLTVVTQPTFLYERGDVYAREVDANELPWLYRCAGILAAGIPLAGSTDAPYGSVDPWLAMRSAVNRTTFQGASWQPDERLRPEQALALFTSAWNAPGRVQRRIAPGEPADLCLLDRPWARARVRLEAADVRATVRGGRAIYRRADAGAAHFVDR